MGKRVCKEELLRLIMECRQSGHTDYQWCEQNGIHPSNFCNWVSKLRKQGYTFSESEAKSSTIPNVQEVVKVDLTPSPPPRLQTEPMHYMFRAIRRVLDEHPDVKAIYPIRMNSVIRKATIFIVNFIQFLRLNFYTQSVIKLSKA